MNIWNFLLLFMPLVVICSGELIRQDPLSSINHRHRKHLKSHEYQNNVVWNVINVCRKTITENCLPSICVEMLINALRVTVAYLTKFANPITIKIAS